MPAYRFDLRTGGISEVPLPAPTPVTITSVGTAVGAAVVSAAGRVTGVLSAVGTVVGAADVRATAILPVTFQTTGAAVGRATISGVGVQQQVRQGSGASVGTATVMAVQATRPANSLETVLLLQMDSIANGELVNQGSLGIPVKVKPSAWLSPTDKKFGASSLQLSRPAVLNVGDAFTGSVSLGDEGASFPPPALSRLFSAQVKTVGGRPFEGWTLEGWAKFETLGDGGTILWSEVDGTGSSQTRSNPLAGGGFGIRAAPEGQFEFFTSYINDGTYYTTAIVRAVSLRPPIIGQWFHFSVVASGGVGLQCYVNGVNDFEYRNSPFFPPRFSLPFPSSPPIENGPERLYIGRFYSGRLDAIHMTLGRRREGDFSPPVSAPEALPVPDAYGAATVTLLHMDGTDGSTSILDSSLFKRRVTARGSASISTDQSRFGSSSLRLYGDGGLELTYDPRCEPMEPFTVEFWVRVSAVGSWNVAYLVEYRVPIHPVAGSRRFGVVLRRIDPAFDANMFTLGVSDGNATALHQNQMAFDTWHHVAVTSRSKFFLDGVMSTNGAGVGSVPFGWALPSITEPSLPLFIGGSPAEPTGSLVGFIDELRMTRGVLYTENFTPPDSPYPDPTPL